MGKREEYTTCMKPHMTGGGQDRKERFCLGAKLCSGKAANEQEAAKLCAEAALNPKPAKPRKARHTGKIDAAILSACIIRALDDSETTLSDLESIVTNCVGQKALQKVEPKVEPITKKAFFKKCYKENPITAPVGSRAGFKELQQLRTMCIAKWKEQEAT